MRDPRPIYINLFAFRFPITAMVSGMHRISGAFLFVLILPALILLEKSLSGESAFLEIQAGFQHFLIRMMVWAALLPVLYHFIAGIRHMLMDMHIGESREGGEQGAKLVLGSFAVTAILLGIWIW
ncbi:MAG: succinate dehydrogenase, cytochrome b556 subunit [Gammaproteobacteria bacterium]|nr:succinate dehydrogenase, cytochrome b556 subunit [Gammaproteobacteria bacterium]